MPGLDQEARCADELGGNAGAESAAAVTISPRRGGRNGLVAAPPGTSGKCAVLDLEVFCSLPPEIQQLLSHGWQRRGFRARHGRNGPSP